MLVEKLQVTTKDPTRGAVNVPVYTVVQRQQVEVLAVYPDDSAEHNRAPNTGLLENCLQPFRHLTAQPAPRFSREPKPGESGGVEADATISLTPFSFRSFHLRCSAFLSQTGTIT